jgi:eukaryotic-like serine/threonine-protein kinase
MQDHPRRLSAPSANAASVASARTSDRESGLRRRPERPEDAEGPRSPRQLGRYELLEPLGSGAMGRVYRACHVLLNRLVALKVMRPELACSDVHVQRFVAEARAVNLLRHPHVIDVMDIGVGNDIQRTPWYVMELLEGKDAATLMDYEHLGLTRVLQIMRQVCEALDAIHAA